MSEQDELEKFTAELRAKAKALAFEQVKVGINTWADVPGPVIELRKNPLNRVKSSPEEVVRFVDFFREDLSEFFGQEFGKETTISKVGSGFFWSISHKNEYRTTGAIEYSPDFQTLTIRLVGEGYVPYLGVKTEPRKVDRGLPVLEKYVTTRFAAPIKESDDFLDKGWKVGKLK